MIFVKFKGGGCMSISAGTIARTICLCLALLNQVLIVFGKGTIDFVDEDIYQIVSTVFIIVTAIMAWWKNNSFTKPARIADAIMKEEKIENKMI